MNKTYMAIILTVSLSGCGYLPLGLQQTAVPANKMSPITEDVKRSYSEQIKALESQLVNQPSVESGDRPNFLKSAQLALGDNGNSSNDVSSVLGNQLRENALLNIIAAAVETNADVKSAQLRVREIEALKDSENQLWQFEVDGTSSAGYWVSGEKSTGVGLEVKHPIFHQKRQQQTVKILAIKQQIEETKLAIARLDLGQSLLQSFINYHEASELELLYASKERDFAELYAMAKRLMNSGLVSIDLVRFAQISLTQSQLDAKEQKLNKSRALRKWLKDTKTERIPAFDVLAELFSQYRDVLGQMGAEEVVQKNPNVMQAQLTNSLLEAELQEIKNDKLPKINIVGKVAVDPKDIDLKSGTSINLEVDGSLFKSADKGRIQSKSYAIDSARYSEEELAEDLLYDVLESIDIMVNLEDILILQQTNISQLSSRISEVENRVNLGFATFDELVDAKEKLYDAQTTRIQNQIALAKQQLSVLVNSGELDYRIMDIIQ
jgi:outer membrane protein TolC